MRYTTLNTIFTAFCLWFAAAAGLRAQQGLVPDENIQLVPVGGNAWISGGRDSISNDGVVNWLDPSSLCRLFVRVNQPGNVMVSLILTSATQSQIKVSMLSQSTVVNVSDGRTEYPAGTWTISEPGYLTIEIRGISRAGKSFGTLSGVVIRGTAVNADAAYVKNNDGNYFYWGRRGPSVHLRFDTQGLENLEWFYSEIEVPEENDVIGSYFMANGFGEGYFGMQVNSETERRVLFSVWSPFKTDDPKSIPVGDRITMLKKGEGVYTGEFGNEGSGGQSYLRYPWKVGQTYGFLLRAMPDGPDATVYTAWFFAPEVNQWKLIASFRRPRKATYLKGLYSFLENFIPETGNVPRMAYYKNQWVTDKGGKWKELNKIVFTGDATARKNYRKDYSGGVRDAGFYLRNCGFFNDFTELDKPFIRTLNGKPPQIDKAKLP